MRASNRLVRFAYWSEPIPEVISLCGFTSRLTLYGAFVVGTSPVWVPIALIAWAVMWVNDWGKRRGWIKPDEETSPRLTKPAKPSRFCPIHIRLEGVPKIAQRCQDEWCDCNVRSENYRHCPACDSLTWSTTGYNPQDLCNACERKGYSKWAPTPRREP